MQEEREAIVAQQRAEEERERKRHQQRLAFLLTQTELYSHFMASKLNHGLGAPSEGTPAQSSDTLTSPDLKAVPVAGAVHHRPGEGPLEGLSDARREAEQAVERTTARMNDFDAEFAILQV